MKGGNPVRPQTSPRPFLWIYGPDIMYKLVTIYHAIHSTLTTVQAQFNQPNK